VQGCLNPVSRQLTVAMEVRDWTPKIAIGVCRRHGDAMDEKPGRYLVTESHDVRPWDSV
jgi:hypothetical protein